MSAATHFFLQRARLTTAIALLVAAGGGSALAQSIGVPDGLDNRRRQMWVWNQDRGCQELRASYDGFRTYSVVEHTCREGARDKPKGGGGAGGLGTTSSVRSAPSSAK